MELVEIGNLIVSRRSQLSLRQEDLSEMSGVTVRTIYKIEEGKGNPSFKTLHKLCGVLGLEITIGIKQVS